MMEECVEVSVHCHTIFWHCRWMCTSSEPINMNHEFHKSKFYYLARRKLRWRCQLTSISWPEDYRHYRHTSTKSHTSTSSACHDNDPPYPTNSESLSDNPGHPTVIRLESIGVDPRDRHYRIPPGNRNLIRAIWGRGICRCLLLFVAVAWDVRWMCRILLVLVWSWIVCSLRTYRLQNLQPGCSKCVRAFLEWDHVKEFIAFKTKEI